MLSPLPAATDQSRKKLGDREFIVMMAILMALNALAIDAMLPAFPAMAAGLGVAGSNAIQYVISAYLLGTGIGSLIHGPLSDRFGRRPVLFAALGGYMLFALICGQTRDFDLFIVMRFAHGLCGAGLAVLGTAIIRDQFSGDAMAKRMSLVFLIFMVVPIVAPSVGQMVLWFAGWRAIYFLFAAAAFCVGMWIYFRLPETLAPENVVPMEARYLARAWGKVITHRTATAYVVAGGIIQGAMFGFLNSSQQVFDQVFDAAAIFTLCFAVVGIGMAFANFANAKIVERFGARRVSHSANFIFILVSLLQLAAATWMPGSLLLFMILLTMNMALAGFIGSNFGSIAMQPFGATAGAASSFQMFFRTLIAAGLGALIGQQFETSFAPVAFGFLGCGLMSLAFVLWGERGKLFTRPGTTRHLPM
jgi:MFS transporter, DHA1 family, multidrug resistance protein